MTRALSEFDSISQRQLGGPLYDPPPEEPIEPPSEPEPTTVVEPAPPPRKKNRRKKAGLRVIGTLIEAGRSMAIIANAEGNIQLCGEGESIETAAGEGQVEKIELDEITLSLDDETLTLKMP